MRRLSLRTGLSHGTIDRAKRGLCVQRDTAELISSETGIPVDDIPHVKRGEAARAETEDEPRAVA
jgi:uncharacterized protein YerC